jgi:D-aminoacyl-tRNA deacylase
LTKDPSNKVSANRVVIIASRSDPASQNIANNLIEKHGFVPSPVEGRSTYRKATLRLVMIDEICIYAKPEDVPPDASSIIFASKHVSSTNTPALTVHATGNLTREAEFGGKPEEVSFVDPGRIRAALRTLRKEADEKGLKVDVTMEATHHGPTSLTVPVCFVEIGSGPDEWGASELGSVASDAVMAAANPDHGKDQVAVGFGGTHYAAKHTKTNLEGGYQIGHVVAKHAFDSGISDDVIKDVFKRTVGANPIALVDWKGLRSTDRQRLMARLKDWGIEAVRD